MLRELGQHWLVVGKLEMFSVLAIATIAGPADRDERWTFLVERFIQRMRIENLTIALPEGFPNNSGSGAGAANLDLNSVGAAASLRVQSRFYSKRCLSSISDFAGSPAASALRWQAWMVR